MSSFVVHRGVRRTILFLAALVAICGGGYLGNSAQAGIIPSGPYTLDTGSRPGWAIYTFTGDGTFAVTDTAITVEILVVGGGGGGGGGTGGGGGAGGLIYSTGLSLSPATYNVSVGAGGPGGAGTGSHWYYTRGTSGANSSFGDGPGGFADLIAIGGGGGGSNSLPGTVLGPGLSGGSGGGGSNTGAGGGNTSGQGYAGAGSGGWDSPWRAGGGGGAGAVGQLGTAGGGGGIGLSFSITGAALYYAGGGGGGVFSGNTYGDGGLGGGGHGGGSSLPTDGLDGFGGGGGGQGANRPDSSPYTGSPAGSGGDGVVIVAVQTVPEPGTVALLAAGLIGLVGFTWFRRRIVPV